MSENVLEMQYANLAQQRETAELGMWAFIATEVLFLGAVFAAYSAYWLEHPRGILEAANHTKIAIGTANTAILLTSSFFMSWASLSAEQGNNRLVARLMWLTAALGLAFLALKGFEYSLEIDEHEWPGRHFSMDTTDPRAGAVFYFVYWVLTGLHAVHLSIGVGVVGWTARRAGRGEFTREYYAPVRVVSLYWHFVDVVWIFVYPMLYLPGRTLS